MNLKALGAITVAFLQIFSISPANADTLTVNISAATDFYMVAQVGEVISAQTNLTAGDPMLWLYLGSTPIGAYDDNSQNLNGNRLNSIFSYTVPAGGGGTYRLRAAAYNNESGAGMTARYSLFISAPGAITYTSTDTIGPSVSSISITANAGADNTFIAGDVITASITWNEAATITGSPRIPIQGLTSKFFTYSSGSGTTSTTFTYTVASGDNDTDGIAINANTLELNGGTIRDAAGNNATLTHSAVTASASLKVDTTLPAHSSSAVNAAGTQLTMTYSEALSSTTAATSTFAVMAAGSSVTVSSATVSGSTVVLALGSTIRVGQSVTVAYTDPTAGNDASAIQDAGGNDAASLSATSVTNNSTVKQNQATLTLNAGSTTFGTNFRLVTTGGSGTGAVSYSVNSGSCSVVNGDSLTATAAGDCSVVARKASDSTFLDAYDTKTVTVNRASRTLTISLANSSSSIVFGTTISLVATHSAGSSDGTLTYSVGASNGCTVASNSVTAILGGGSCSISATMSQGVSYETSTATLVLTVTKANQNRLFVGEYTAFANVSSYPINVYGGSGTGAVTRSLLTAGSANCSISGGMFLTATQAGSCTVQVSKAADTNYLAQIVSSTIYWVTWSDAYATRAPALSTNIELGHQTGITKYSFETLTVTSFADINGNPITSATTGQTIRIVGTGFVSTDSTTQATFTEMEVAVPSSITTTHLVITIPTFARTGIVTVESAKGMAIGPILTISSP